MRPFVPRLSRAVGFCLGAVWCAAPLACATPSNVEEELSKMRREMAAMRKELSDTQLAMQRLESQVTLLSVGRGAVQKAPETEVARAPEAAAKNKTARGEIGRAHV